MLIFYCLNSDELTTLNSMLNCKALRWSGILRSLDVLIKCVITSKINTANYIKICNRNHFELEQLHPEIVCAISRWSRDLLMTRLREYHLEMARIDTSRQTPVLILCVFLSPISPFCSVEEVIEFLQVFVFVSISNLEIGNLQEFIITLAFWS